LPLSCRQPPCRRGSCRPKARSASAGHPRRAERPGAARCAGSTAAPGTRRPCRPGTSCGKAALVGIGWAGGWPGARFLGYLSMCGPAGGGGLLDFLGQSTDWNTRSLYCCIIFVFSNQIHRIYCIHKFVGKKSWHPVEYPCI